MLNFLRHTFNSIADFIEKSRAQSVDHGYQPIGELDENNLPRGGSGLQSVSYKKCMCSSDTSNGLTLKCIVCDECSYKMDSSCDSAGVLSTTIYQTVECKRCNTSYTIVSINGPLE